MTISPSKKRVNQILSSMSFLIVSHVAFTGHAQELESFLKERANKLTFIGHPFSYASQKGSIVKIYEGIDLKIETLPKFYGPEVLLYFRDFLATFYLVFKGRTKFHVFVGVDPLNAFVGLFLKRLGYAKITIFYVIDYVPQRFKNKILNNIYHSIDRMCVYHSDYTWNLTFAMASAREQRGIKKDETNQMVVPTGTHPESQIYDTTNIAENSIVFLSHLRKGQGIELVIEALPKIIKEIPPAKLIVIGTGPLEQYFKDEVAKQNLEGNVAFLGYIEDHKKIEEIVSKCKVGLAPYVPDPNSFTWYADPGKPKVYLGCGIPIVITKVPEVAFEVSRREAGIAINYDADELSKAVIKILQDKRMYQIYRANAISFASEMEWSSVFEDAFAQILEQRNEK